MLESESSCTKTFQCPLLQNDRLHAAVRWHWVSHPSKPSVGSTCGPVPRILIISVCVSRAEGRTAGDAAGSSHSAHFIISSTQHHSSACCRYPCTFASFPASMAPAWQYSTFSSSSQQRHSPPSPSLCFLLCSPAVSHPSGCVLTSEGAGLPPGTASLAEVHLVSKDMNFFLKDTWSWFGNVWQCWDQCFPACWLSSFGALAWMCLVLAPTCRFFLDSLC